MRAERRSGCGPSRGDCGHTAGPLWTRRRAGHDEVAYCPGPLEGLLCMGSNLFLPLLDDPANNPATSSGGSDEG